jgi:geranylgeranyl transferase type-2 subunit beta
MSSKDQEPSSSSGENQPPGTTEISVGEGEATTSLVFHRDRHIAYIAGLADKLDKLSSYEGAVTEHLRVSGVYWTYAGLSILVSEQEADDILGITSSKSEARPSIIDWVLQCYDMSTGGFGGNVGHDGHLLYTLSAVQILVMADYDLEKLDTKAIVDFVVSLQQPDGR